MLPRLELVTGRATPPPRSQGAGAAAGDARTTRRGSSPCSSGAARPPATPGSSHRSRTSPPPISSTSCARRRSAARGWSTTSPPATWSASAAGSATTATPPRSACWWRTRGSNRARHRAARHARRERARDAGITTFVAETLADSRHVHRMVRRLGPTQHRVRRLRVHHARLAHRRGGVPRGLNRVRAVVRRPPLPTTATIRVISFHVCALISREISSTLSLRGVGELQAASLINCHLPLGVSRSQPESGKGRTACGPEVLPVANGDGACGDGGGGRAARGCTTRSCRTLDRLVVVDLEVGRDVTTLDVALRVHLGDRSSQSFRDARPGCETASTSVPSTTTALMNASSSSRDATDTGIGP